MERLEHSIEPIFNKDSKLLILGTFPSPKSRENEFFYGNPNNRFWKVMEKLFEVKITNSNEAKRDFLLKYNIAIWDVVKSCDIIGAKDSSIKNVVPNDINYLVKNSNIKNIITTGNKAYELYNKYVLKSTNIDAIKLPSTSPANASMNLERLIKEYKIIKKLISY